VAAEKRLGDKPDMPVKFFAAILFSREFGLEDRLYGELEEGFGKIDFSGEDQPFDLTDYYNHEMGSGIKRRIVSFAGLGQAEDLPGKKLLSSRIEKRFADDRGRCVNIDPGYIDYYKVVLASFKEAPQKVYLCKGVFADMVLLFQNGDFISLPWTFPDIKSGLYMDDFK